MKNIVIALFLIFAYAQNTYASEDIELTEVIFAQTTSSIYNSQLADIFSLVGIDKEKNAYHISFQVDSILFGGNQLTIFLNKIHFEKEKFLNYAASQDYVWGMAAFIKYSKDRVHLGNLQIKNLKNKQVNEVTNRLLNVLKSASAESPTILKIHPNKSFEIKPKVTFAKQAILNSFTDRIAKQYYYGKYNNTYGIGTNASYIFVCGQKHSALYVMLNTNLDSISNGKYQLNFSDDKYILLNGASQKKCQEIEKSVVAPGTGIEVDLEKNIVNIESSHGMKSFDIIQIRQL